ncbi:ATP-binding protein [Aeromonas caviae]|uniref:ATP-binding protein n=1 Tax=Aeromonas caviae TaxID=648 RepID=UPI002B48465B|nr:ATP-binding protein [Aeromonas caviae]
MEAVIHKRVKLFNLRVNIISFYGYDMKIIYVRHLDNIRKLDNNAEKLTALTSTLRSLLQTTAIIIFEVIKEKAPSDEIEWDTLIERFNKPSDGTPIDAINTIIPIAREYISRGFIYGWFEIAKGQKEPLANQLRKWIEFRNKRPGHGVLDKKTTDEWSLITESLIENTLIILGDMIPTHISNQVIKLQRPYSDIVIKTPLINNNHAIVITGITPRKGIWKLKGQLLSLDNAEEFTVDLSDDNVFSNSDFRQKSNYSLSNIISKNKEHSFFHNIPVRQTDTFEGRKEEIQKLIEWFDDQDSRFCLVYGDGGYGKTTLVLEFLNQYLDSQFDFDEPLPTLVLYHTAKMTRWSEKGLVHLTGVNPMMDECIRDLIRFFIPILTPDWYSASGRQLIDKAVSTIRDQGLTRNDILLILDNTETLATTSQEVKELGEFFKSIGKLIGRVIITSRRRELIGANPIPVEGLSDNEAVSLMNALAQEYHAKPILQAGEKTLKRIANSLNNKPILLEALVKFISRSKLGIEDAVNNVFKKTNEDLLNFLYEDAWARISKQQKEIFLVSINISSPLDQISISKICQEIELQHSEFHSSLAETHFAILTDYGKSYTLELVDLAKRFFSTSFQNLIKLNKQE